MFCCFKDMVVNGEMIDISSSHIPAVVSTSSDSVAAAAKYRFTPSLILDVCWLRWCGKSRKDIASYVDTFLQVFLDRSAAHLPQFRPTQYGASCMYINKLMS